MKAHILKTDPDVFDQILDGSKTFEIRKNDRSYEVGDYLVLRKTLHNGEEMAAGKPLEYLGNPIVCKVTHMMNIEAKFGNKLGPCAVMSIHLYKNLPMPWSDNDVLSFWMDEVSDVFFWESDGTIGSVYRYWIDLKTGNSNIRLS